jgi:diguanylate cyclase (GGDEF)-like protein
MPELTSTSTSRAIPVPRGFILYASVTMAAALVAVGLAFAGQWVINDQARFWALAVFVLAGELLPIPVPRRHGLDKITISTPFAFAMLLCFGAAPAMIVYAVCSVVADCLERTAPIKVAFNAAQYVLTIAAAAAVMALASVTLPVALTAANLPVILAAGAAFFAANHLLAGAGAALLADLPVLPYLQEDFAFQAWTAGCLLSFTPALVAAAYTSVALIPVSFVPLLAIYAGGRQAAVNSHRASHDALTELPNRSLLAERLRSAVLVAEREQTLVAAMIIDLDDFKAVNDTLGHEFGDAVLKKIAPRLEHALGPNATLARLGGDEFAVVLESIHDEAEASAVAQRLLEALDRTLEVDTLALQIAASVGIACFPQHGRTVPELLRHADVALYCAKASDVPFQLYAFDQDDYSLDRLALASQLRRGIDRGELVVHYQPKVPLRGGGMRGVEALARWNHPQLGSIGPDGFIPLAEQTGVIKLLTDRVLEATLRQCELWRREGMDLHVSVNVSTRNLLDHDLPATIRGLLERFHLPASSLQLEITESRIVADLGRARTVLNELRGMGVTIAIDDFGTGFSSLSQLQQLPIDEIKIDRSFVMRMETDRNDAVLVRSIIELGRNLGLRVTAEGVESESIKRSLSELGCDFVQGYHIGRPGVAEECRRSFDVIEHPVAPPLAAVRRIETGV